MSKEEIYILYGSQTGNAEFIAKDLHEKCQEKEIASICHTLNDAKKINLKEVAKAVIIVCSTTGNGDAPENADGWWRANKLKSLVRSQLFFNYSFPTNIVILTDYILMIK